MARSFNGTTTIISAASAPTPTGANARTIAIRFNTSSVTTRQFFLYTGSEGAEARFAVEVRNTDSILRLSWFTGASTWTTALSNNTWYSVMVSMTGGVATHYLNGVAEGSGSASFNTGTNFYIGQITGNVLPFAGNMADWAGWNVALGAGDAKAYGVGFSPRRIRPQSLVFYAPMVRTVQDVRASLALTDSIPTGVADHPRSYG